MSVRGTKAEKPFSALRKVWWMRSGMPAARAATIASCCDWATAAAAPASDGAACETDGAERTTMTSIGRLSGSRAPLHDLAEGRGRGGVVGAVAKLPGRGHRDDCRGDCERGQNKSERDSATHRRECNGRSTGLRAYASNAR